MKATNWLNLQSTLTEMKLPKPNLLAQFNPVMKYVLVFLSLFIFLQSYSQDVIPTKGKEFWVGFMENFENDVDASLDLFITSNVNTSGTVSIPLQGWNFDFTVNANTTTTVTIPNNLGEHQDENQIISNKGILVETQDTVSVFAINFSPFTADGTKILPTKSLGTTYRVPSYSGLNSLYGSSLLVVSTEDDTEVEIVPSVDTPNGDNAGVPFTVQLDRGESYQIILDNTNDLTGTTVRATEASGDCRPFAVYSGASCVNIPLGCTACDHIYEQNFSVDTWGTEYYVVPYEFADSFSYRVLADTDNTDVFIDGVFAYTLNAGEFVEENYETEAVCINMSSPASIIQYMQGTTCSGSGDPAMLILNDASQKINNVTMSTVVSPQITNHGVNIVLETVDVGTFSIDGVIIAPAEFTQFPNCPTHSYAQIGITEGSHTLNANNGFTAYSFGLGDAESYSYSVGSFSPNPFGDIDIEEAFCSSDQVVLQAEDPGFELYWYNLDFPLDTLGNDPVLVLDPPIISGIYVVAYNNLISGCEREEFFSVEVPVSPNLDNITEDQTICQYESVQLNVVPNPFNSFYLYTWTPSLGLNNPNIANPIATPLTTTTYEVNVSSPTGCAVANSAVTITVEGGQFSNLEAFADDYEICQGEEVQCGVLINEVILEDDFDPGISWGLWEDISNGVQSMDCGAINENAVYFNGVGERSAQTIALDVSAGGFVSFALQYGEGVFPCDAPEVGEDVVLEYSLDGTNWTDIQILYSFSLNGWEQFNVEIPVGAESTATFFKWRQLANSGVNQDNWSLDNIAVSVLNMENINFNWFSNEGTVAIDLPNPVVTPLEDITYYVEAVDGNNGCNYLDSIFINVGQNFTLEITPDTTLCDVQGIDLEVTPSTNDSFDFLWTPNNTTISSVFSNSPTVTPMFTTVYEVEVTSDQGCVNTAQVEVSVNQLLDLSLTSDEDEICLGEQTVLHATVAGNPSNIEYIWSPAESLSGVLGLDPTATPTSTTLYEVIATDTIAGCSLSEQILISVSGDFTIDAGEDQIVCDAAGLTLNVVPSIFGAYDWSWQPGAEVTSTNSATTQVVNNETNEFIVSASDGGCSQTDTVNVFVLYQTFDLGPDLSICEGEELTLDTGLPDENHFWSTTEDTSLITISDEQMYIVEITSALGCSVIDSVFLEVIPLPVLDLGEDQSLCVGDVYDINAGNPGADYQWSTMEFTQAISVETTGVFSVEVVDVNNCVNSDEVSIVFNENPTMVLPDEINICEDEGVTLDAENEGSNFLWTPNAEDTQSIDVNISAVYSVSITSPEGCTSLDQTELIVATYPAVNLGPDQSACEGEFIQLDAQVSGELNVNWSVPENTSSIEVTTSGVYTVTVDNDYCFSSDAVSIFFNPLPENILEEEITTCFVTDVDPVVLSASNFGSSYLWSTGEQTASIEVDEPGLYSINITTPFGCESTFYTEVYELCIGPYIYVPNSFTPNSDGINDGWKADGIFIIDFEIQVFNRWGEVVFESTDVNEVWQGNDQKGNHFAPSGVYTYQLRFKYLVNEAGAISDWNERKGQVTLVR